MSEYIISTFKLRDKYDFTKVGPFYISGQENKDYFFLEGYLFSKPAFNRKKIVESIKESKGIFHILALNEEKDTLIFGNDTLGIIPCYYYCSDRDFAISNNFWALVENISCSIDYTELRRWLLFRTVNEDGKTFIENIKIVPPGVIVTYNGVKKEITLDEYFSFKNGANNPVRANEYVEMLSQNIGNIFSEIKGIVGNNMVLFGNSGGFDSRIVPHFAKKNDIKLHGYSISDKRDGLYPTGTYYSSVKIAHKYKFVQKTLNWKPCSFDSRMTLDIRNSPLNNSDIFKNNYQFTSHFKYMITGNPAYLVIRPDDLYKSSIYRSNIAIEILYWISKLKYLKNDEVEYLKRIFGFNGIDEFLDYYPMLNDRKSYANIGHLKMEMNRKMLDRVTYSGGFESSNRKIMTFYLYYPIDMNFYKYNDTWSVLSNELKRELVKHIDSRLMEIPNQEYSYYGTHSYKKILYKILKRESNWGLNYSKWVGDSDFIQFANRIYNRENPIFNDLFNNFKPDHDVLRGMHPHFYLDILKIKSMLDVIYNDDYEVFDNDQYRII